MNWLDHEYLVPVFIGNADEIMKKAKELKKKTGIRPHIFAERFSFWQRLIFNCHTVDPLRCEFVLESLKCFARELDRFSFPVIVRCGDYSREFIDTFGEEIESRFLAVTY